MSDLRQAAQQALEALERARPLKADYATLEHYGEGKRKHYAAMDALRAALEQPVQEHVIDCPRCGHCCPQHPVQEPVAFMEPLADNECADAYAQGWNACVEAHKHAAPPQREPLCVCGDPTALNTIHRADAPCYIPVGVYKRREPLTEEQIADAANSVRWSEQYHVDFARAIERAHGIGGEGEA